MSDERTTSGKQDSTDILLLLGGLVVAGIGLSWLLLAKPWEMLSADDRVVEPPVVVETDAPAVEPASPAPALEATLDTVRVGQTELEVGARLEFELRTRGSEWHPFTTIVASGARSALPHAGTSRREIVAGDGEKTGPYCQKCLDGERRAIRLKHRDETVSGYKSEWFECHNCQSRVEL